MTDSNVDHVAEAKRQLSEEGNALASIAHSLIELNEVIRHAVFPQRFLTSWHEMTEEDLAKSAAGVNITVQHNDHTAEEVAALIARRRLDSQLH